MAQKTGIPKGTRDFSPIEMAKRNYIFDTIRNQFKLFGYKQIETPSMENLSTLMGKYGEEGDKLLFKILDSGDYLNKVSEQQLLERNSIKLTPLISEKGLRYDLTVPFARFVVQHRNDITLPFKRFQIQPVWRADRPQKGRYREFYQCDADVVGSTSLFNEAELVSLIDSVFSQLKVKVLIKLNNRKILTGIAEVLGCEDKIIDITVAIDKIDKIGLEKVNEELLSKGIPQDAVEKLKPILELSGDNQFKINTIREFLSSSEIGLKGIEEMEEVLRLVDSLNLSSEIELDLSLARGLNYYTGTIIEVKAKDVEIGSISGGGRYDNLTGVFGLSGISGVGISFGADRIYDVLNALNLYPDEITGSVKILFVNFGEEEGSKALQYVNLLHKNGISGMLYPDSAKMRKQMSMANDDKIPYVALLGKDEIEAGKIMLKDMESGEQELLTIDEIIEKLK